MIIAKSSGETLTEHTNNLIKISNTNENNRIEYIAIIFHDTGKATEIFQKALKNNKIVDFRHEIISALIYYYISKTKQTTIYDKRALYAIITHHKHINTIKHIMEKIVNGTPDTNIYYETKILSKELSKFLNNYNINVNEKVLNELNNEDTRYEIFYELLNEIAQIEKELKKDISYRILRGKLMFSDHIASYSSTKNIEIKTHNISNISIYDKLSRKWKLYKFQEEMYNSQERVIILEASTGSGKTEGALLYSEKYLKNNEKLVYIISNKASLNAQYYRLSEYFDRENISLLYSNVVQTYLEILKEENNNSNLYEYAKHLTKLSQYFVKPIILTTIYSLFKLIYKDKSYDKISDIILSQIYNSVIVFDEVQIHYEKKREKSNRFEYEDLIKLICFLLENTNAKIVIMSATLSNKLIKDIKQIAKTHNINIKIITYTNNIKLHKYKIINKNITELEINEVNNDYIVIDNTKLKKPILIVTNTVNKAIKIYKKIKNKGLKTILLHSRFKLKDRKTKEKEIINNFNNYDVIVTTQIVEVSVDISANSMLTETAPLSSLIQRFGRVNRHNPKEVTSTNILIYNDPKDYHPPYRKNECAESYEILKEYENQSISKDIERDMTKKYYEKTLDNILPKSINCDYNNLFGKVVETETIQVITQEDYEKIIENISDEYLYIKLIENQISIYYYYYDKFDCYTTNIKNYNIHVVRNYTYDNEIGLQISENNYTNEII